MDGWMDGWMDAWMDGSFSRRGTTTTTITHASRECTHARASVLVANAYVQAQARSRPSCGGRRRSPAEAKHREAHTINHIKWIQP